MKEIVFEAHNKKALELPFIFHKDYINCNYDNNEGTIESLYYTKSCPMNWHENIEIEYFISGSAAFVYGGKSIEANAGDVFIAGSNKIHYITSDKSATYYCLIVDSRFCQYNGIDIANMNFNIKAQHDKTAELFRMIEKEYTIDNEQKNAGIRAAVLNLLVHICRNEKLCTEDESVSNVSTIIKKAVNYMNEHFSEKIKIDTICDNINISKYYFIREFKRETRYSPINYINYIRCERAKEMMLEGMAPGEVCTACGFDDHSYFAKVFKRYTGVLPSEFNKKYK